MNPRIFFGAQSFSPTNSGIARLARLTSKVLAEEAAAGRLEAACAALGDRSSRNGGLPVRGARGSRLRFVAQIQRASLTSSHMLYDFLGMARAHQFIPFRRIPFMTWLCGIEVWEAARPERLRMAERAGRLLAISEYTRERAGALHPELRGAHVCWPGTEQSEAASGGAPVESREPVALFVGRIDEGGGYKGAKELIEAWPKVVSSLPGARLLIVGDGPGREAVDRLIRSSAASGSIERLNFVQDGELERIWKRARAFAMPSRGEGFGLVYAEAMRQGVPVIASVHDAGDEINRHGETGFNVNLDRKDELPEALITVLRDDRTAREFGEAARERWARHFSYGAFRERFVPQLRAFTGEA